MNQSERSIRPYFSSLGLKSNPPCALHSSLLGACLDFQLPFSSFQSFASLFPLFDLFLSPCQRAISPWALSQCDLTLRGVASGSVLKAIFPQSGPAKTFNFKCMVADSTTVDERVEKNRYHLSPTVRQLLLQRRRPRSGKFDFTRKGIKPEISD